MLGLSHALPDPALPNPCSARPWACERGAHCLTARPHSSTREPAKAAFGCQTSNPACAHGAYKGGLVTRARVAARVPAKVAQAPGATPSQGKAVPAADGHACKGGRRSASPGAQGGAVRAAAGVHIPGMREGLSHGCGRLICWAQFCAWGSFAGPSFVPVRLTPTAVATHAVSCTVMQ